MAASPRPSSAVQSPAGDASLSSSAAPEDARRTLTPRILLIVALVLLIAWPLAFTFGVGQLSHVLLLVGLMLLMMAGLTARDNAVRSAIASDSDKR